MAILDPALCRRIILLSYPVMLAMLSQTLINQVDHILVGHLPQAESTPGQTALQISQILLWMFGGFLSSITVGTQALTARRAGAEDIEGAGAVSTNSLILALWSSLVVTAVCWLLAPAMFQIVSTDEAVRELGVPFLRWRFLQITGMVMTASLKSFFDGLGKTRVHMGAALTMNLANFLLCVALIFGDSSPNIPGVNQVHAVLMVLTGGHLPKLGVPGAGLASMLSSYIGLLVMAAWSMRSIYDQYKTRRLKNASLSTMWSIIKLSVPSGVATLFAMVGFAFVLLVVGRLDKLAGHGVGRTIYATATSNIISVLQLVFISCIAYGTATATLVSQNMGAKEYDKAEVFAYTAAKLGVLLFLAVGLLMSGFAGPILRLWNPDEQVVAVGKPILQLLGGVTPLICVALVFTQALYGAGNTVYVMVAEAVLHFTCLMPMAYVLGLGIGGWAGFGLWGVWGSLIFYIAALAAVMFLKFRTGTWKQIQI